MKNNTLQIKKITVSAVMCALAVAIMSLGAVMETLDMTVAAAASLTVVFVYLEIGSPYTWFCWLISSLLCFLFFPGSLIWTEYFLIYGLYPIVKGYIERLPRPWWILGRLLFFHAAGFLFLGAVQLVFQTPIFGTGAGAFVDTAFFGDLGAYAWLVFYVLAMLALFAYDFFLTMVVRIYVYKYHKKAEKFFK